MAIHKLGNYVLNQTALDVFYQLFYKSNKPSINTPNMLGMRDIVSNGLAVEDNTHSHGFKLTPVGLVLAHLYYTNRPKLADRLVKFINWRKNDKLLEQLKAPTVKARNAAQVDELLEFTWWINLLGFLVKNQQVTLQACNELTGLGLTVDPEHPTSLVFSGYTQVIKTPI